MLTIINNSSLNNTIMSSNEHINWNGKKVVIVSNEDGYGHHTAANSIKTIFENRGAVVDIVHPFNNKWFGKGTFNNLQKKGFFITLGFLTKLQFVVEKVVCPLLKNEIEKTLIAEDQADPDLIISVQPVGNATVYEVAKNKNIPMMIVPTDYGIDHFFHDVEESPKAALRIAIPDETVRAQLPPHLQEIAEPTGWPVDSAFQKQYSPDELKGLRGEFQALDGAQFNENDKIFLISMGGQGSEQLTIQTAKETLAAVEPELFPLLNPFGKAEALYNDEMQKINLNSGFLGLLLSKVQNTNAIFFAFAAAISNLAKAIISFFGIIVQTFNISTNILSYFFLGKELESLDRFNNLIYESQDLVSSTVKCTKYLLAVPAGLLGYFSHTLNYKIQNAIGLLSTHNIMPMQIDDFLEEGAKVRVVVLCGKNQDLLEDVQRIRENLGSHQKIDLHALGFQDREKMSELVAMSAAYITKPGGATVAELISQKTYGLFTTRTSGFLWEYINLLYAEMKGAGKAINNLSKQVTDVVKGVTTFSERATHIPASEFPDRIISLAEKTLNSTSSASSSSSPQQGVSA